VKENVGVRNSATVKIHSVLHLLSSTRGVLDLIVYCFEAKSTILVLFTR